MTSPSDRIHRGANFPRNKLTQSVAFRGLAWSLGPIYIVTGNIYAAFGARGTSQIAISLIASTAGVLSVMHTHACKIAWRNYRWFLYERHRRIRVDENLVEFRSRVEAKMYDAVNWSDSFDADAVERIDLDEMSPREQRIYATALEHALLLAPAPSGSYDKYEEPQLGTFRRRHLRLVKNSSSSAG